MRMCGEAFHPIAQVVALDRRVELCFQLGLLGCPRLVEAEHRGFVGGCCGAHNSKAKYRNENRQVKFHTRFALRCLGSYGKSIQNPVLIQSDCLFIG